MRSTKAGQEITSVAGCGVADGAWGERSFPPIQKLWGTGKDRWWPGGGRGLRRERGGRDRARHVG